MSVGKRLRHTSDFLLKPSFLADPFGAKYISKHIETLHHNQTADPGTSSYEDFKFCVFQALLRNYVFHVFFLM